MIANVSEVLLSTACFCLVGGLATALFSAVVAVPLVLAAPLIGFRRSIQLIGRSSVFVALLHILSLIANAVFVAAFRDRLYYAADPVIDFLPYLPFSGLATDPACGGHLLGASSETTFVVLWECLLCPCGSARLRSSEDSYPCRFHQRVAAASDRMRRRPLMQAVRHCTTLFTPLVVAGASYKDERAVVRCEAIAQRDGSFESLAGPFDDNPAHQRNG